MSPLLALTRRRAIVAAFVALLLLLMVSPVFQTRIDQAGDWTIRFAERHPTFGGALFVLFSAVSAMLAFFSSAVLVPPATLVWGRLGAFLLLWAGWTLGAVAAYGLGAMAAPLLVRLGYHKKIERYQQAVSGRMRFWSVVLFCLMVPSEVPGYLFGSARYSFPKFLAAMLLAESVWAAILVYAGRQLMAFRPSGVLLAAGAIVLLIVLAMVIKKSRGESPV